MPKVAIIRLTRARQAEAKRQAASRGQNIPAFFADLLAAYSEGEVLERKKPIPTSELMQTRVELPIAVHERALKRAKGEEKHLSTVVSELVAGVEDE